MTRTGSFLRFFRSFFYRFLSSIDKKHYLCQESLRKDMYGTQGNIGTIVTAGTDNAPFRIFRVPVPAIFRVWKMKKCAGYLDMSEICVNTHSDRRFTRVILFKKICKGRNSFFREFPALFACRRESRHFPGGHSPRLYRPDSWHPVPGIWHQYLFLIN